MKNRINPTSGFTSTVILPNIHFQFSVELIRGVVDVQDIYLEQTYLKCMHEKPIFLVVLCQQHPEIGQKYAIIYILCNNSPRCILWQCRNSSLPVKYWVSPNYCSEKILNIFYSLIKTDDRWFIKLIHLNKLIIS